MFLTRVYGEGLGFRVCDEGLLRGFQLRGCEGLCRGLKKRVYGGGLCWCFTMRAIGFRV